MERLDRFNLLSDFDYSILDDKEFKEDSVREEIIFPIIKALGYSSSGGNKILRSKKLKHPYVSIGSQQKEIYIVPDYIMQVNEKCAWIMEAKSPNENILKTKHVEQAYSYAIHSEIRAKYYALCNGKEFLLYSIYEYNPILHFSIQELPDYWSTLVELLSPQEILNNTTQMINKDFGLHIKKMGFTSNNSFFFLMVPVESIAKINNDLYTISTAIKEDDITYFASFDFNHKTFLQLEGKIPNDAFNMLRKPLIDSMIEVRFADNIFFLNIECNLGEKMEENRDEIFLPLIIKKFIKLDK